MPATPQTLDTLVCGYCQDLIAEPEEGIRFHDACWEQLTFTCEVCEYEYAREEVGMARETLRALSMTISTVIGCDDTHGPVCEGCVSSCEYCGTFYADGSLADECCDDERNRYRVIHGYSYRPDILNYWSTAEDGSAYGSRRNEGKLYLGVELEIVRLGNCAEEFLSKADEDLDRPKFFFLKEDGSIGYDGAELVTMPATLEAHAQMFPFDTIEYAMKHWRIRSYEYQSCGFHIHVNRTAFTDTHLWRFIRFQLRNEELCKKIAQRDGSSYASWDLREEWSNLPAFVKNKRSNMHRYLAINFQNRATVELRYFKGNLMRGSIMKNIEYVDALYHYTKHMSYADVCAGSLETGRFLQWLEQSDKYPNLKHFLNVNNNQEDEG
jgi:hypothetical protein